MTKFPKSLLTYSALNNNFISKATLLFDIKTAITVGVNTELQLNDAYDKYHYLLFEIDGIDSGECYALVKKGYFGYGMISSLNSLIAISIRYNNSYSTPIIITNNLVGAASGFNIKRIYGLKLY